MKGNTVGVMILQTVILKTATTGGVVVVDLPRTPEDVPHNR